MWFNVPFISIPKLNWVIISCLPKVSPAAGTDHQVAAASPSAAGSRDGGLGLERGFLLWALQGREALGAGPAGDAAGGREALETAAAAKSPAERPRELTHGDLLSTRSESRHSQQCVHPSSHSTQACQWAAPPWEASGWMVSGCGPRVWRAKESAAAAH